MMPNALYIQHFNDPFQPPSNPGEYPDDIPANASAQRQKELIICHKAAKLIYDTYKVVTQCLRNPFQEAIHEDYLAELDDLDMGLTNVHPSIIYQHIVDRYAKIDLKMADDNRKQFNAPMDPLYKKTGALSSICCRCQQSNRHGKHGANGGDPCGGNRSHA